MTKFESETQLLKASSKEVFEFLSDFRNFEELMPDKVDSWEASRDKCSFRVQGLASLSMHMITRNPYRNIHIVSEGNNPLDYSLSCFLFERGENACQVQLVFEADLNPFIRSVASKPLQHLTDLLAEKLSARY